MHPSIQKLYEIAQKPKRTILGLMSGTSLDGLDIALCEFEGTGKATQFKLRAFTTVPYQLQLKNEIRSVFSKERVSLEKLTWLNSWLALQNAKMILEVLSAWKIDPAAIDVLASHGQTVYHVPKYLDPEDVYSAATLQIVDGDHLAVHTGIITISDFRQKHIAAGGEGAPLSAYGDYLLCSAPNENRILLNMGGIANYTFLPSNGNSASVFSTDTGPGNTLMDACMRQFFDKAYDEDGSVAKQGKVNALLLSALKQVSFFELPIPKTTGPEYFNIQLVEKVQALSGTSAISKFDLIATLNRFTAETIVEAIQQKLTTHDYTIYMSGGGMYNSVLVQHLKQLLPEIAIHNADRIGIPPDAKEAILFAILANECVAGKPMLLGKYSTKIPITMGKISLPE